MHNIVILGGNFAGVGIAHQLLRRVIPLLNSASDTTTHFKVTLVSISDHTYFTVGAPRVLSSPQTAPIEKLFTPISEAFRKYQSSEFTFVHGEAIGVNEDQKTVSVKGDGVADISAIQYALLVIATGTTTNPLWKLNGDRAITVAAFQDMHRRLPGAKSVVVAGGGPTGVEVAAEIAHFYPSTDVTILSGTTRLLSRVKNTKVSKAAEEKLAALGVKTVHHLRVTASDQAKDDIKTTLKFDNGTSQLVDIYLNATGTTTNSGFLPNSWLDICTNKVVTDGQTLRATKAPAGVYAIGDVASHSKGTALDIEGSIPALAYSIWYDIQTGKVEGVKRDTGKQGGSGSSISALKEKKNKQVESDMIVVPTGPDGGVGAIFGWKVPSWLVWLMKSRTFRIESASKFAHGL